jgi:hypothetical protein
MTLPLHERDEATPPPDAGKDDRQPPPAPRLADELAKAQYEPLLPVEKRLIGYSLAIGLSLLALLVWLSRTKFDVAPSATPSASSPVR